MKIWDSSLVIVTGKGGAGRTTSAVALALAAARTGRRAAVVELYGMASVPLLMGLEHRDYSPQRIAEGVDCLSLTPRECMNEYGRRKLKLGALSRLVFGNKAIGAFVEAVPGFHDLLQLGKIEHMVVTPDDDARYDLVVVDAPATGHGLTFLATTSSMMDMTRVGPFYELAATIHALLSDPLRTSLALVALPEELPVNESLELVAALRQERAQLRALVLNQVRSSPVGGPGRPSWDTMRRALLEGERDDLRALVGLGDQAVRRMEAQRRARVRLQEGTRELTGRRVITAELPRMEVPRLEPRHVRDLGAVLHAQLGAP